MRRLLLAAAAVVCAAAPAAAQAPQLPGVPRGPVRQVHVSGATDLGDRTVLEAGGVRLDELLPVPLSEIAQRIERRYREAGYSYAHAALQFDEASGRLDVTINEGRIDEIEFQGVPERLAQELKADFALRAGDVFNRRRAYEALRALLRPTRGAVEPGRAEPTGPDTAEGERAGAFDMVDRNGRRVLLVGLRQPSGRFRLVPDLGEREDWYTPVDGFTPSLGMGVAVYDHQHFNHAYVSGHLSARVASGSVGYALGFERPLFAERKLFVGGELHDLTATDDRWRLSSNEASVDAIVAHRSYRNYFRRRGLQMTAAWRVQRRIELLFGWRREREEALPNEADFSIFNGDDTFRPNAVAEDGTLSAIVFGASLSGEEFGRESLDATYRRHQLDTLFGQPLREWADHGETVWHVDWTSEVSSPGALQSDFDFRRHIVAGRVSIPLSPHQDFAGRILGGWSAGVLPPQRQFGIGGLGSVHGYPFNEEIGDDLALLNLEYLLGWRDGFHVIGFFDAGRVAPRGGGAAWLKGVGLGLGLGDLRLDLGYRLDDVPGSLQVLFRFGRTF